MWQEFFLVLSSTTKVRSPFGKFSCGSAIPVKTGNYFLSEFLAVGESFTQLLETVSAVNLEGAYQLRALLWNDIS